MSTEESNNIMQSKMKALEKKAEEFLDNQMKLGHVYGEIFLRTELFNNVRDLLVKYELETSFELLRLMNERKITQGDLK